MEKAGKKAKDSAKPKKKVAKVAKLPKDLREKRGLLDGAADDQEEDEEQVHIACFNALGFVEFQSISSSRASASVVANRQAPSAQS